MNQIKKVLKNKGIEELKPTETLLDDLGVTLRTWNKWVENKKDPEVSQLSKIASFVGCSIEDLLIEEAKHATKNH